VCGGIIKLTRALEHGTAPPLQYLSLNSDRGNEYNSNMEVIADMLEARARHMQKAYAS